MSTSNSNPGHGRGHGNGGHGWQARCRGSCDHGCGNHLKAHSSQAKFQGTCEALKGHIFDCSDYCQADQYATTLKKLSKHVGAMFKNGGNVGASIVAEVKYAIPCTTTPTAPTNPGNLMVAEQMDQWLFDKWLDALIKHKTILNANIQSLYSLMLGQCMDLIQTKLKQQITWANVCNNQDRIALLVLIKMVVHHFKDKNFFPWHFIMPSLTCTVLGRATSPKMTT